MAEYQDNEQKNIKVENNNSDLTSKVMPIKSKDWQIFSVWRVACMRGTLVVSYSGKNGGIIFCNKKTLENILNDVKTGTQYNKEGKLTYQFQDASNNYITRCVNNQLGTSGPSKVSFKYVRVSFITNKCVLYQNSYEVDPNTLKLGQNYQSIMIEMSLTELLGPLPHIGSQAISNKTESGDIGEFDID